MEIKRLSLIDNRCRMGAGYLLMSKAEEWAKLIGAVGVRINSRASRAEAQEFYREIENEILNKYTILLTF